MNCFMAQPSSLTKKTIWAVEHSIEKLACYEKKPTWRELNYKPQNKLASLVFLFVKQMYKVCSGNTGYFLTPWVQQNKI